jgi:transposase InsO family protein
VLEREKARFRCDLRVARKAHLASLIWLEPGTVWAADFTELGGRRRESALAVRDLASTAVLDAAIVPSQDQVAAVETLAGLFVRHGPPLVLKIDNGPAFIAKALKALLAVSGVLPLYSPPGTPAYNGACERGVGLIKATAEDLAIIEGHVGSPGDAQLAAATWILNTTPTGRKMTATCAHDRWVTRGNVPDALRDELHRLVDHHRHVRREELHLAPCAELDHAAGASIDRQAISEALCKLELLVIRRR